MESNFTVCLLFRNYIIFDKDRSYVKIILQTATSGVLTLISSCLNVTSADTELEEGSEFWIVIDPISILEYQFAVKDGLDFYRYPNYSRQPPNKTAIRPQQSEESQE